MFLTRAIEKAEQLLEIAKQKNLSIITAESCSAGMLANLLTEAPGAAEHFHGGFVVYTKDQKASALRVPAALLKKRGAVCAEVATAMVRGALENSPADLAVAITGVTGPDPDEDGNPVGRVFIAVGRKYHSPASVQREYGDIGRQNVRLRAIDDALDELIRAAQL